MDRRAEEELLKILGRNLLILVGAKLAIFTFIRWSAKKYWTTQED